MKISFTLPIKPATKKNSGQIIQVRGRSIIIPSKQYKAFENACLPYLHKIKLKTGIIDTPVNMKCIFYTESRRKIDLPNLLNAIDDTMVKAGLIADDNRDIIAGHDGSRVFYDKVNPRLEIEFSEMLDYEQWKKRG